MLQLQMSAIIPLDRLRQDNPEFRCSLYCEATSKQATVRLCVKQMRYKCVQNRMPTCRSKRDAVR